MKNKKISLALSSLVFSSVVFPYPVIFTSEKNDYNQCNFHFINFEKYLKEVYEQNKKSIYLNMLSKTLVDTVELFLVSYSFKAMVNKAAATKIGRFLEKLKISSNFKTSNLLTFSLMASGTGFALSLFEDKIDKMAKYLSPEESVKIEEALFKELEQDYKILKNCYKVDPQSLSFIEENLERLRELIEEDKNRGISSTVWYVNPLSDFSERNNLIPFFNIAFSTYTYMLNLKKEPVSSYLFEDKKKVIEEIKSNLLVGKINISDVEKLPPELLEDLLKDEDVKNYIKNNYEKILRENPDFFKKIQKMVEVDPEIMIALNNILNLLTKINYYLDVSKEIELVTKVLKSSPTEEDLERLKKTLIISIEDKLRKSYHYINPVLYQNMVNKLENSPIEESLLYIYQTLQSNDFSSTKKILNKIAETKEGLRKIIQSLKLYSLTEYYSQLVSLEKRIRDSIKETGKLDDNLLFSYLQLEDKIREVLTEEINKNPEEFFKIEKKEDLVNFKYDKNYIYAEYLKTIVYTPLNKDLANLLKGIKIIVDSVTKDKKNFRAKGKNGITLIVENKDSLVYTVYFIFDPSKEKYVIEERYLVPIYEYNTEYKIEDINSNYADVKIKYLLKRLNRSIDKPLPLRVDLNYVKDNRIISNIFYYTPSNKDKEEVILTVKDRGIYKELIEGDTKNYFDEERGQFSLQTNVLKITNKENRVFEDATISLHLKDSESVNEIVVTNNKGDILLDLPSEKIISNRIILTIPYLERGESQFYVNIFKIDKKTKMQNAYLNINRKIETLEEYLKKVREVSSEEIPKEIVSLLSNVKQKKELLKQALLNEDYVEFTRILESLRYDLEDLNKKVLEFMNDKLGKHKTTEIILKDLKKRVEFLSNLIENSEGAFSSKEEYQEYLRNINSIKMKINEIENLLKIKEVDEAYEEVMTLKEKVNVLETLIKNKIFAKRYILFSTIQSEIDYLTNVLKNIEKYDSSFSIYLTQLKQIKNTLNSISNSKLPLDQEIQLLNSLKGNIKQIKSSVIINIKNKEGSLEEEVKKRLESLKNTYERLNSLINILESLNIPKADLEVLYNSLDDVKRIYDQALKLYSESQEQDPLYRYYYLTKIKALLVGVDIDINGSLRPLLQEYKEKEKKRIRKIKLMLLSSLKESDNKEIKSLIQKISKLEQELDSTNDIVELVGIKKKINEIEDEAEFVQAVGDNKLPFLLMVFLSLGLILIIYVLAKRKIKIPKLKVPKIGNKKDVNPKSLNGEKKLKDSLKKEEPIKREVPPFRSKPIVETPSSRELSSSKEKPKEEQEPPTKEKPFKEDLDDLFKESLENIFRKKEG